MNRLTTISIATAVVSVTTAIVLAFALLDEVKERSAAVQAVYKAGLKDGETFTRGQIVKSQIEQEIINEQRSKIAKEKL